ncbi:hypothetical protein KIPB_011484 [Kipferlia bialata]|uniref:Uncharacterized protein n=1 Tax=Kipferlia bialata TaxID=797122 RepID=A0A391P6P0_9EUKA|nr:hypothetical protein KIPB_011484 [Kipferlia bialata]|eukprot:g11484.t1
MPPRPVSYSASGSGTRVRPISIKVDPAGRKSNPIEAYRLPAVVCYILSLCVVLIQRLVTGHGGVHPGICAWVKATDG